jgi:hypothetical protein
MTFLKLIFAAAFVCVAQGAFGDDSFQSALYRPGAAHPAQYSFADLYRATVAGPTAMIFPVSAPEAPTRVATVQGSAQVFFADLGEPNLAMLLLSGIALAAWVGRRRLGYGL